MTTLPITRSARWFLPFQVRSSFPVMLHRPQNETPACASTAS